jgi:hypothetical protein
MFQQFFIPARTWRAGWKKNLELNYSLAIAKALDSACLVAALFLSASGSSLRNLLDEIFGTASESLLNVTKYNTGCANFDLKSLPKS